MRSTLCSSAPESLTIKLWRNGTPSCRYKKAIMKTIAILVLMLAANAASAQVTVKGHVTKNGTYVPPHERTAPNKTMDDNYSTKGNVNPYTGKEGTVQPSPQLQYTPPPVVHQSPPRDSGYQPTTTKAKPLNSF